MELAGGGASDVSSCSPHLLMALAPVTTGLCEGLIGKISILTASEQTYLAGCPGPYFPDVPGLADKATALANGLREFGNWTRAVGEAFVAADTDGGTPAVNGWNGDQTNPLTGATAVGFALLDDPAGNVLAVPDQAIAQFLPAKYRSELAPSDDTTNIAWGKDPYDSLLGYIKDPANDTHLGESMLDSAKVLASDYTTGKAPGSAVAGPEDDQPALSGDLERGSKILSGISSTLDALSLVKSDFGAHGPGGVAGQGVITGAGYVGSSAGAAGAEETGAMLFGDVVGDLAGPLGSLLGGLALSAVATAVTKDLFGPDATQQANDAVAGASPGSPFAFDLSVEHAALPYLEQHDPSLVPIVQATIAGEAPMKGSETWQYGQPRRAHDGPLLPPAPTLWHPAGA